MATHDHDHHHHHDGEGQDPPSEMTLRVKALESLLVEKGLVDPAALDAIIDTYEHKVGPRNGARVVARAWSDPEYKRRLLDDAALSVSQRQMEVPASQLRLRPRADTAYVDVRVSVEPIEDGGRTTRCRASRELVNAAADETPLAMKLGLIPIHIESPQEPEPLDRARGDLRMTDRELDRFRH